MNILGLVFSLLLILSYGFYACWDQQTAATRLRRTYVGHQRANRTLLNKYQSELYSRLKGKGQPTKPRQQSEARTESPQSPPKPPELNPLCARLNLWPLIQEGRENHPLLYEVSAELIRTFYTPLQGREKRFEYHFLDAFLLAAKQTLQGEAPFALEKITFADPQWQRLYYKMLKGTKRWDLATHVGLPPLLDYIKAEPSPSSVCLFHSHPDLIAVLFGTPVALPLYTEIHRKEGPALTPELVETFCRQAHQTPFDPELLKLLDFKNSGHHEMQKTFLAEDRQTDVYLRQKVYLKS